MKAANGTSSNPDKAPTSNSQPQPQQTRPLQPSKRRRSVESVSFQKILNKTNEIKKLVFISKLSRDNNCAEVEIKHGGTRYTVVIDN